MRFRAVPMGLRAWASVSALLWIVAGCGSGIPSIQTTSANQMACPPASVIVEDVVKRVDAMRPQQWTARCGVSGPRFRCTDDGIQVICNPESSDGSTSPDEAKDASSASSSASTGDSGGAPIKLPDTPDLAAAVRSRAAIDLSCPDPASIRVHPRLVQMGGLAMTFRVEACGRVAGYTCWEDGWLSTCVREPL